MRNFKIQRTIAIDMGVSKRTWLHTLLSCLHFLFLVLVLIKEQTFIIDMAREFSCKKFQDTASKCLLYPICPVALVP